MTGFTPMLPTETALLLRIGSHIKPTFELTSVKPSP